MASFQHITPPLRLFCGEDSLAQLARELDRVGSRRAVIVCGASLAREGMLLALVREAMGERCAGVFAGARAHSPVAEVEAAARELARLDADAVVPVGGGSAIVTARAASIVLADNASLESMSTTQDANGRLHSPKLLAPKLPQLVVPTTPTTAIVKAGSAVFSPQAGRRFALFDPKTRAQAVFIHPAFVASAPRALVTTASLNTLTMAMEGLMSRGGNPLADAPLMHALRLVWRHLSDDATDDGRVELVLAAIMCGQGTDHTGAGVTSVLSHAIGARYDLENGTLNAILLPHVLRFNEAAAPAGLVKIAAALGVADVTGAIEAFTAARGIAPRLRDVGVPRLDLPEIAEHGMADWFLRGNPRAVGSASELLRLLDDAW